MVERLFGPIESCHRLDSKRAVQPISQPTEGAPRPPFMPLAFKGCLAAADVTEFFNGPPSRHRSIEPFDPFETQVKFTE